MIRLFCDNPTILACDFVTQSDSAFRYRYQVDAAKVHLVSEWRQLDERAADTHLASLLSDMHLARERWDAAMAADPVTGPIFFRAYAIGFEHYLGWRTQLERLRTVWEALFHTQYDATLYLAAMDDFESFCELSDQRERTVRLRYAYRQHRIWTCTGYSPSPDQWKLMIDREVAKRNAYFNSLVSDGSCSAESNDRSISVQVRREVWTRDRGRCCQCGGREKLEYDHIIPVAMGGSSTARNVQLLCEKCNREKGPTLG